MPHLSQTLRQTPNTRLRTIKLWLDIPTHDKAFGDETYPVQIVKAQGSAERLYLWINEPYPANNGDAIVSEGLSRSGDVWFIDVADALFILREKTGYRNLTGDFLLPLFKQIFLQYDEVVVISSDVSSVPVLRALRHWQALVDQSHRNKLINVVLMFPSLYVNTPAAGESRALFPIAKSTALPITIIQPERGSQANTIQETARTLISGGSLVDIHRISNGVDGYYRYQNIEQMSKLTGELIPQLVAKKQKIAKQISFQVPAMRADETLENPPLSQRVTGIKELHEPARIQDIRLKDYQGKDVDLLRDYRGKTLLINFWATWCPPCVEEIPSMNEALRALGKEKFEIVSISFRDPQRRHAGLY